MIALAQPRARPELDLTMLLADQKTSVEAELLAATVFREAAEQAVKNGDQLAHGRLDAVNDHISQLRARYGAFSVPRD